MGGNQILNVAEISRVPMPTKMRNLPAIFKAKGEVYIDVVLAVCAGLSCTFGP